MDTGTLHERGRLSQRCPACGVTEAAGAYCTSCYGPTGAPTWYLPEVAGGRAESLRAAQDARRGNRAAVMANSGLSGVVA